MTTAEDDIPAVVAIAHLVREAFPELQDRAFAVAEAALTKENMPNLPLAFICLLNIRGVNQSNDVKTPLDIEETICVEFWLKSKNYARTDGTESPFYAFQDYKKTMDTLFSALTGYFTPQRKPLRFISMDTTADEYCITICFKFSVVWRWCSEPNDKFHPIRINVSLKPNRSVDPIRIGQGGRGIVERGVSIGESGGRRVREEEFVPCDIPPSPQITPIDGSFEYFTMVAEMDIQAGMPVAIDPITHQLQLARADTYAKSFVVGIALELILEGFSGKVATDKIILGNWTQATGSELLATGVSLYLGVTGGLVSTPPSTIGQSVVIIGTGVSDYQLNLDIGQPILL